MNNTKKFALICAGSAIVGFGTTFFLCGGGYVLQGDADIQQEEPQAAESVAPSIRKSEQRKIDKSDFYMPQYKDINNVCGIGVDDKGNHAAIVSSGACPTNEALITNYGAQYESLTDTFRPKEIGGSCGTAHLVTEGARIGKKDMAKLNAMAAGNLDSVNVLPKGVLCPTQAELSDDISNSVGVPVRFEYNNFDTNIKKYPLFNVSESEYQQNISAIPEEDMPIYMERSGTNVSDINEQFIPKILLTPETKEFCGNDYKTCGFSEGDMSLTNEEGQVFQTKTANGQVLPKFMMTKGAWDACGGIFSQCDYIPDAETPDTKGTVVNKITHQSYTSKEPDMLIYEDESDASASEETPSA